MVTLGAHEAMYNESPTIITQGDSADDAVMCADVPQHIVGITAAQAVPRKPAGKPEFGPCFRY